MAMGKCRECGADVSDKAAACPSCGVKRPIRERSLGFGCLAVLVFAGIIGVIAAKVAPTSATSSTASSDSSKGFEMLTACQVEVQQHLRDPDSAVFPNAIMEQSAYVPRERNGIFSETFQFRAKNGFGGYNMSTAVCRWKHIGNEFNLIGATIN
jgi:DNA-directed RNA polymerase subunit RPC12/RpoP